jgi:hypothetical protein
MLLAASSAGTLPAGEYLIGARPDAALRSFIELEFDLTALLHRLQS